MPSSLQQFENWIEHIRRRVLPEFRLRLQVMLPSSQHTRELSNKVELLERILADHDRLSHDQLEHAARMAIFESLHHGIQHCAQGCLDAEDNDALGDCMDALADIDQQLRLLGRLS